MEFITAIFIIALLLLVNMLYNGLITKHTTQHTSAPPQASNKVKPSSKSWQHPKVVEGLIDYKVYIKSPQWKLGKARISRLITDNYSCVMCGDDYKCHVHHINYENLGNETQSQLITLCPDCHEYTHLVAGKGSKTYLPQRKLQ